MSEDAHPQVEQQPLAHSPGPGGPGGAGAHVGHHRHEVADGDGDEHAHVGPPDPFVDADLSEDGTDQAGSGLDHHQQQAPQQRAPVGGHEPPQGEGALLVVGHDRREGDAVLVELERRLLAHQFLEALSQLAGHPGKGQAVVAPRPAVVPVPVPVAPVVATTADHHRSEPPAGSGPPDTVAGSRRSPSRPWSDSEARTDR